jgi:hypothetical protein
MSQHYMGYKLVSYHIIQLHIWCVFINIYLVQHICSFVAGMDIVIL